MDILVSLRAYIKDNLVVQTDIEDVGDGDSLLESGIIDSMGVFQLVTFLETQFGVEIDDEEMVPENFETMTGIVALVNRKLEDKGT